MSSSPLVTVAMPTYGHAAYIRQAINSVLQQTLTDFELLVFDDASNDGTQEILRSIVDPRVRVHRVDRNQGYMTLRQRSLHEGRGRWLASMDSDDMCHPDRLRREVEFMTSHPDCLFVGTIYGLFTPNGQYLAPKETFDWRYLDTADITRGSVLFSDPSVLMNRAKALEVGGYDADLMNEKPLWYKLLKAGRGAVMGEALYWHRWVLGSISRPNASKITALTKVNADVRARYDPEHSLARPDTLPRDADKARTRHFAKAVNYYLLAGDYRAATEAAYTALKTYPWSPRALKLVALASLRRRSLRRIWKADPEDPRFTPAEPPFSRHEFMTSDWVSHTQAGA